MKSVSAAAKYWDVEKEQTCDAYLEAPILNEYLTTVREEICKHYNTGCPSMIICR
ncbi:MAG TPA: hypothetical protein VIQ51_13650 [Chryseosolibacter sp.]